MFIRRAHDVTPTHRNTPRSPPPQLPRERVHVLQADFPLRGHSHVGDHRAGLDRVGADEVRDGAQRAREGIAEISETFPLEEGHAPAVHVSPRAPPALAEAAEREAEVCRCVGLEVWRIFGGVHNRWCLIIRGGEEERGTRYLTKLWGLGRCPVGFAASSACCRRLPPPLEHM